jgi:hypothetical protein
MKMVGFFKFEITRNATIAPGNRLSIDILKEVVESKKRKISASWGFEVRNED